MSKKDLELSSISYINKDFGAIYTESLDLAKTLTNKWDPSQSNESDPGVVLLKEAAIIADHINYNIDKNVLESFLPSATQDKSVRNIVEMNGYTPKYYRSAEGYVSVIYKFGDEEEIRSFEIPSFTLTITDADSSVSYIQAEPLMIIAEANSKTSVVNSCKFIEGVYKTLTVNDSTTILLSNLDSENRLYFPDSMVAQNGVFIRNANNTTTDDYWKQTEYLLTQPVGSLVYKFDYDSELGLPFVEFPSDIANIIGEGLQISYITTSGANGNVSASLLNVIESPSVITDMTGTERNKDSFTLYNPSAFSNGADKESINEMYRSYKQTVGTFDTLVTCRDYANAIYNSELVSNVVVTDRRTDYNRAANVMTYDENGIHSENIALESGFARIIVGETAPESPLKNTIWVKPDGSCQIYNGTKFVKLAGNAIHPGTISGWMSPYTLGIYASKAYSSSDFSKADYSYALNRSYEPIERSTAQAYKYSMTDIKDYIDSNKCICHDYTDKSSDDIYYFKALAPLTIRIKPYAKVLSEERDDIVETAYRCISDKFNAHEMEWGERLDSSVIKTALMEDPRIKDVDIENINYSVYAVTAEKDYPIDVAYKNATFLVDILAKNVLAGRLCIIDFDDRFNRDYGHKNISILTPAKIGSNLEIPLKKTGTLATKTRSVTVREIPVSEHMKIRLTVNQSDPDNPVSQTVSKGSSYMLKTGDAFEITYSEDASFDVNTVNTEILELVDNRTYAITPPLDIVSDTEYQLNGLEDGSVLTIEELVTEIDTQSLPEMISNRKLKKNEHVLALYPNYYATKTYGTYVNYSFSGGTKIPANTNYVLQSGEELVMVYTLNGENCCDIYSSGTVINASFDIKAKTEDSTGTSKTYIASNGVSKTGKFDSLTSSQTISIQNQMSTVLNDIRDCYWSLATHDNTLGGTAEDIILESNEYFIYTNAARTEFIMFGEGTRIHYEGPAVTIDSSLAQSTIQKEGLKANIGWVRLDFTVNNLTATEMKVVTLNEGDEFSLAGNSTGSLSNTPIVCSETNPIMLSYKSASTGETNSLTLTDGVVRTRLDIIMSKDQPQVLYEDQSLLISSEAPIKGNKAGVYVQASAPIAFAGATSIDTYGLVDLYVYAVDPDVPKKIMVLDKTSETETEYSRTFKFQKMSDETFVLPIAMFGNQYEVSASVNTDFRLYNSVSEELVNNVLLTEGTTFIEIPGTEGPSFMIDLKLTISYTAPETAQTQQIVEILDINVLNGFDDRVVSQETGQKVNQRISQIIESSNNPSISFFYMNRPDSSVAIDISKYAKTDRFGAIIKRASENSSMMFDVNNIISDKIIAQIDLAGSSIDIDSSMLRS